MQARLRLLILTLSDMIALGGIFMGCAAIYRCFGGDYTLSEYCNLWPMLFIFCIFGGVGRLYHGHYFYPGAPVMQVEEIRRVFFTVTLTYLLLCAYLALTRRNTEYSRLVLLVSWMGTLVLTIPLRNLFRAWMKRCGVGQIPVLIAGAGRAGRMLAAELDRSSYYGFRTVGFVDDSAEVPERLGTLAEAVEVARARRVPILLACLPIPVIRRHLRDYLRYFQHVSIMFLDQEFPIAGSYPVNIGGLPGVEVCNQLKLGAPRTLKTVSEVFLAAAGILCLWPLFGVLALAVRLSGPGPVFYRATRLGIGGKTIRVWKFRTMFADADQRLEEMLANNPELAAEWRKNFKLDNDPRITRLGKFLRKTSLDELPQLFNVITGEMAMIGPRPIVEAEKSYYGENYEVFSRVKPGITGLWQVSGRSDTSYDRRVALDMFYVFNWSIWLDIMILVMTFQEVLRCRGAK